MQNLPITLKRPLSSCAQRPFCFTKSLWGIRICTTLPYGNIRNSVYFGICLSVLFSKAPSLSFRGAERRGNLLVLGYRSILPGDCHALRARNDKFGGLLREADKHFPKYVPCKRARILPCETARKRTNLHIAYSCTICRFPGYMGRSEGRLMEVFTVICKFGYSAFAAPWICTSCPTQRVRASRCRAPSNEAR